MSNEGRSVPDYGVPFNFFFGFGKIHYFAGTLSRIELAARFQPVHIDMFLLPPRR